VKVHENPRRFLTASDFVPDARLISIAASIPVTLMQGPTTIEIRFETFTNVIERKDITAIFPLNDTTVAILSRNVQYLLDFSPRGCHVFFEGLQSPPESGFALGSWTERWIKSEITNFEYLCVVNFASGRAFNGDLSMYPIFPALDSDFEKPQNFTMPPLDGSFERYESADGSLLAPPELYFFPQICGSFEIIYQNRKRLEKCEKLDIFLTKVFGTHRDTFLHRQVFLTKHPARERFIPRMLNPLQLDIAV
jgi:hypothetical protein